MKLALIPPFELLEYTDETYCQLMLPQLLENDVYRYVYQRHGQDAAQFIILDNGANEGEDWGIDDLLGIAREYRVDEIVLPDVIGDAASTRALASSVLNRTPFEVKSKYMYVLQGQTHTDFVNEAMWAAAHWEFSSIGLPRHMIETLDDPYARADIAHMIYRWNAHSQIHLLGGSPLVSDEINRFRWPPNIRSHDTSSPFNYAYEGRLLSNADKVKRPDNYFERPHTDFDVEVVNQNVRDLMEWTGNDV